MALPTSTNNVTVRKLSSTIQALWNKITTALGGKADKVTNATSGNFAGLDANGNLTDSGKKASDFVAKSEGVTNVDWDSTNKKITKTINGSTTDVVSASTLKTAMNLNNVTNDAQVKRTEMGAANGVATLDSNGKIPSSQIPGTYDDVKEGYLYEGKFYYDSAHTTEIPAEGDKVYLDIPNNKTYRWSGTQYVVIGSDLALGETSSTAYRGDRGKAAYDHSQITSGNPHNVSKSDVGLGSVVNTGDSATPVSGGNTKFTTGGAYTELNKKVDKETGKGLSTNDYTTTEKNKLAGIAAGAEVNQNAFSKVKVGTTTVEADSKTDTLEIEGSGATAVTADATKDKLVISSTDQSVTDVGHHYSPAEDSSSQINASGGSASQLPTASTGSLLQVVTGIKRDSKGHVVGVESKGLWSPNSVYSPQSLGFGYAGSTTNSSAAFTASISSFSLKQNGIVVVKFSADVPESATLNVTRTGDKAIRWKGAAITAGIIQSGDTCMFSYDGTYWNLVSVDRSCKEMTDQEVIDLVRALT